MKVLVIGNEVSDFLCPLFTAMKERYGYEVDLYEIRGKANVQKCAHSSFNFIHDISLKTKDYPKGFILKQLLTGFFIKKLFETGSFVKALKLSAINAKFKDVIKEYSIVHVFYLTTDVFLFLDALKDAKKLVVSMWGSDIFHNNENFKYENQKHIIARADYVTVHHKEMKEVFLSKFGRAYEHKVSEMLVLDDKTTLVKFSEGETVRQKHINSFKARYNIPSNKRVVVVGHSGHEIDNHIPITKALRAIKERLSEDICLVYPMTYGCESEEYANEIIHECESMGIQHVVLTDFLPYSELIELRYASEILLRLSSFDAFSLALTETICTGNVIIVGAWLPYGKFRGNNVYMKEVYEFEDLKDVLGTVLDNYDEYQKRSENNGKYAMMTFDKENSAGKLHKIYS